MIDDDVWEKIKGASQAILNGYANKVEGDGWLVYRVGSIIRIDIKEVS